MIISMPVGLALHETQSERPKMPQVGSDKEIAKRLSVGSRVLPAPPRDNLERFGAEDRHQRSGPGRTVAGTVGQYGSGCHRELKRAEFGEDRSA